MVLPGSPKAEDVRLEGIAAQAAFQSMGSASLSVGFQFAPRAKTDLDHRMGLQLDIRLQPSE